MHRNRLVCLTFNNNMYVDDLTFALPFFFFFWSCGDHFLSNARIPTKHKSKKKKKKGVVPTSGLLKIKALRRVLSSCIQLLCNDYLMVMLFISGYTVNGF